MKVHFKDTFNVKCKDILGSMLFMGIRKFSEIIPKIVLLLPI